MADLPEATSFHESALQIHPLDHSKRPFSLSDLAGCLKSKFELEHKLTDWNRAISIHQGVLGPRPAGHPNRTHSLNRLALCFNGF